MYCDRGPQESGQMFEIARVNPAARFDRLRISVPRSGLYATGKPSSFGEM